MSESNEDELVADESWDSETSSDEESADGEVVDSNTEGAAPAGDASGDADGDRRRRRRRRRPRSDDAAPLPDDERARQALDFVTKLMVQMQMECTVRAKRPKPEEPAEIQLEISGRDAGRVIGKKGQVLAAVQYLTNRIVNRPGLDRRYVTVDAEGYRSRRDSTLATMARRLGKQAVDEGKIITFEPMNPRDRRVIHLALAKFEGVVTKSEGEGDDRRVQIIPVRR
jgi:spoIIIJ-associated protein